MRIVTQTLDNGKIIAKANGKQRTVVGMSKNTSENHAQAAFSIIEVIGFDNVGSQDSWACEVDERNEHRLIWNV